MTGRSRGSSAGALLVAMAALGSLLAASAAAPAAADLLVTRDGDEVETDGPWEVRGRLVVFTRPDGTLASMRLAEVDLEASHAATAAARAPAEAEASGDGGAEGEGKPHRRPSVLSLTERDLPPVARPAAAEAGTGDGEATAAATPRTEGDAESETEGEAGEAEGEADEPRARPPARADDSGLRVSSWRDVSPVGGGGTELFGSLENASPDTVARMGLTVRLYGPEDELLAEAEADLTATSVPAGRTVNFRVTIPGVFAYDRVELTPRGQRLARRPGGGA